MNKANRKGNRGSIASGALSGSRVRSDVTVPTPEEPIRADASKNARKTERISVLNAYRKMHGWFGMLPILALPLDGVLAALPFVYVASLYFARNDNRVITFAYTMPIRWLCAALVTLFVLSSIAMLHLLRVRFLQRNEPREDTALIGNIIAAAGIFYALVMGVIATATWDDFKLVSESVQKEVGAAGNMFEFSSGYEQHYREELRRQLDNYVNEVLVCDWDAQKIGVEFGKSHNNDLEPLISSVISFDPKTSKEQILHPVLLGELGKLIDARDARVRAVTGIALPDVLWVVVSGCSLIVLLMVCWGPAQETKMPLPLVGCWGALVGFVVFLTIAMDHPLWGELSVSQHPYVTLQKEWVRKEGITAPSIDKSICSEKQEELAR